MIEIELTSLFLMPLVSSLAFIVFWWLAYTLRDILRQAPTRPAHIYRCAVCDRVYVDERDVPLARCPTCGCLNEAIRR